VRNDPRETARADDTDARYHKPHTVAELTQRNITTIATLETAANARRTKTDVIADAIAAFCGSMRFVWVHIAWFGFWLGVNTLAIFPKRWRFDPFPFQFLTLIVSLEAIFLSTFILISQNRQALTAERRNHLDLQINLLSEQENSKMLAMMEAMMKHMGLPDTDPEVHILEEATQPGKLVEQIEQTIEHSEHH
jgi:uncharacterized membrane protein